MGHEAATAGGWGATGFDNTGALIIILRTNNNNSRKKNHNIKYCCVNNTKE